MRIIEPSLLDESVFTPANDDIDQLAQILITSGGHSHGVAEFFQHRQHGPHLCWNQNVYRVTGGAEIGVTLRTLFRVFSASDMYLVENETGAVPSIDDLLSMTWDSARETYRAFQLTLDLLPT